MVYYIRQMVTAFIGSCVLGYLLFKVKGFIGKTIVLLFLIFALSMMVSKILFALNKEELAKKVSKIYVTAFLIYWFGFLIYWDYVNIVNREYISVIFSLPFWFGGCFVVYRRFKRLK